MWWKPWLSQWLRMRSVIRLLVVAIQWEEYILFISLAYIHVPKWIFEVVKHTVYVSTTQYKQRSFTLSVLGRVSHEQEAYSRTGRTSCLYASTLRVKAYKQLVCPALKYASYSWDPLPKTMSSQVEAVQRRSARVAFNIPHISKSSTTEML